MVFYFEPQGQVTDYKTYQIAQPLSTHFRKARCEEVECPLNLKGWVTRVPIDSQVAGYIRNISKRKFREVVENGERVFTFYPGQQCFAEHMVSLERPQLFIVRDGDHRGNPTRRSRRHTNGKYWVEDFAEHQDRLKTQLEKG